MKLCLGVRFISETLSNLIRNHNKSVLVSSKLNKGSTHVSLLVNSRCVMDARVGGIALGLWLCKWERERGREVGSTSGSRRRAVHGKGLW